MCLHPVSVVSVEDVRNEVFRVLLGSVDNVALDSVSRSLGVPTDQIRRILERS